MTLTITPPRLDLRALALPALLAAGSLLAVLAITLASPASGPIAAVFPPWWSGTQALIAASATGSVVRFGAPFVVIVVPTAADPEKTLRRSGAWLVLNPQLLGGCSTRPQPAGGF